MANLCSGSDGRISTWSRRVELTSPSSEARCPVELPGIWICAGSLLSRSSSRKREEPAWSQICWLTAGSGGLTRILSTSCAGSSLSAAFGSVSVPTFLVTGTLTACTLQQHQRNWIHWIRKILCACHSGSMQRGVPGRNAPVRGVQQRYIRRDSRSWTLTRRLPFCWVAGWSCCLCPCSPAEISLMGLTRITNIAGHVMQKLQIM